MITGRPSKHHRLYHMHIAGATNSPKSVRTLQAGGTQLYLCLLDYRLLLYRLRNRAIGYERLERTISNLQQTIDSYVLMSICQSRQTHSWSVGSSSCCRVGVV